MQLIIVLAFFLKVTGGGQSPPPEYIQSNLPRSLAAPYKIGSSEPEYTGKTREDMQPKTHPTEPPEDPPRKGHTGRRRPSDNPELDAPTPPTAITNLISTTRQEVDLNLHLHLTKQGEP